MAETNQSVPQARRHYHAVLGRGEISIDGRYIGNTPEAGFECDGENTLRIECDHLLPENFELAFRAGERTMVQFDYKSFAPHGIHIDYSGKANLRRAFWELKGDDWMRITYVLVFPNPPTVTVREREDAQAVAEAGVELKTQWSIEPWVTEWIRANKDTVKAIMG